MAKRSDSKRDDKQAEYPLEDAGKGEPITTVRLICVMGVGRYIIDGPVTGKHYEFVGNNALDIEYEDAEILLSKRRGGCCGNNNPSPIFMKA